MLVANRIEPLCPSLGPWVTLAAFNWDDQPVTRRITLDSNVVAGLPGQRFFAREFFTGQEWSPVSTGARLLLPDIPAHGCRLVRFAPWDGQRPVLAGTDRHFSGGGVEVAEWVDEADGVRVRVESPWSGPVCLWVAFPAKSGACVVAARCQPGRVERISNPNR